MSLPPATPPRLGDPVDLARPVANPASITRPPVVGNVDQLAIPQQAGVSTISPTVYTRDLNVPGTNISVETPRRMPGDVGNQFYRPVAGDPVGQPFTRDGRPLRNAGIGDPINSPGGATPRPSRGPAPVNAPSPGATVSAPQSANPGQAVNPRTPWTRGAPPRGLGAGAVVAGGASVVMGSGGAFERVGGAVGGVGGWIGGGNAGAAAGAAIGGSFGTGSFPVVGTVSGAGVGGAAGGIAGAAAGATIGGSVGRRVGRAIDNVIPDLPLPWPFGGEKEYPNQTDPEALGQGSMVVEGDPGEIAAGSVSGVSYRITWTVEAYSGPANGSGTWAPSSQMINAVGPISKSSSGNATTYSWPGGSQTFFSSFFNEFYGFNTVRNGSGSISRLDGGTDPTVGVVPPTFAPNPARTAPQGNPDRPWESPDRLAPPAVPFAPLPDEDNPIPWPLVSPLNLDLPGLMPEPELPPNFEPAPNLANVPSAEPAPTPIPAGKPDLSPDAAPGSNPGANLGTDPDTPVQPVPFGGELKNAPAGGGRPRTYELPDGTTITENEDGSRTTSSPTSSPWLDQLHGPVVLPVGVPVGGKQPVNTPAWNLTNQPNERPTPYTRTETPPVRQSTPGGSNKPPSVCRYEQQRVADIQRKATDTNQKANNPVSGFPGLYGLQIEARAKLGQTFELLGTVNQFMRKAWEMTRMQKVLDVLTFIGVMHNVSMLSRDVGETFFQLVSQGVQAVGIRDEEDNVIDVGQVIGKSVENLLKGILGESVYNGIGEAWNKANRIISSASAIIWTVRSISDASLDLMEWIGENTGRIGNALKRWGVVGERSYPWMSESARAQSRLRNRFSKVTDALENAEDRLSVYTQATSAVIEVQEETAELGENWQRFRESVEDGIPDPWADNNPVKDGYDASKAISDGPDVPPSEAQKG